MFQIIHKHTDSDLKHQVNQFIENWNDDSLYISTKTSGSTGVPKIIQLEKEKMIASAKMTGTFFNFSADSTLCLALSPETIGGKMMLVRAMVFNLKLIVVKPSRNPIEQLDEVIDFIALVPMQMNQILIESKEKLLLLNKILLGGAPVSNDLIENLAHCKSAVYESFGMTETMSHFAIRSLNQPKTDVFNCLPGVSIDSENGLLSLSIPTLGIQHLKTTDEIEQVGENQFRWLGRRDFAINSGGLKFHPEQLEQKISHLFETRFFFAGEPDKELGQRIVLFVEAEKLEQDQIESIKNSLEKYENPKHIYFIDTFVETQSGKINRIKTQAIHVKK